MKTVLCGVAVREVTPPVGLSMSGFVARMKAATGAHDPLTVRALCVGDTAVVTVDVIGLHEDTCAEIQRMSVVPDEAILIHATHTHGGPASMQGRLGGGVDQSWLDGLVDACVAAVEEAWNTRVPATIHSGYGKEPGIATNRRRTGGPVDGALPVVRVDAVRGGLMAILTSYACHPVVLGPGNARWTADYPWALRRELESRNPGAVALFMAGCAGDANTGHVPTDSLNTVPSPRRTFAEAERIGAEIAVSVTAAGTTASTGPVTALRDEVALSLTSTPPDVLTRQADEWEAMAGRQGATAAETALWLCWADWAAGPARDHVAAWSAPVSVLRWCDVYIVALPGEPFAVTGTALRCAAEAAGATTVVVAGYTNGCPGYLPPRREHEHGGYEVEEAHRYYGMPGAFAPSSVGRLEACAAKLIGQISASDAGVA